MTLQRFLKLIAVVYIAFSLPVMAIFVQSEYVRFVVIQLVTNWKGKAFGLSDVYIGDSITAGGRNWGAPFNAINLAASGLTTWQIEGQIKKAIIYDPNNILILAGTNDIIGRRQFDLAQFEQDYASLLDRALKTGKNILITEIPYTALRENTQNISDSNQVLRQLAADRNITTINLNETIAPDGLLLPEFTVDGVHFSPPAYRIWRKKIRQAKSR